MDDNQEGVESKGSFDSAQSFAWVCTTDFNPLEKIARGVVLKRSDFLDGIGRVSRKWVVRTEDASGDGFPSFVLGNSHNPSYEHASKAFEIEKSLALKACYAKFPYTKNILEQTNPNKFVFHPHTYLIESRTLSDPAGLEKFIPAIKQDYAVYFRTDEVVHAVHFQDLDIAEMFRQHATGILFKNYMDRKDIPGHTYIIGDGVEMSVHPSEGATDLEWTYQNGCLTRINTSHPGDVQFIAGSLVNKYMTGKDPFVDNILVQNGFPNRTIPLYQLLNFSTTAGLQNPSQFAARTHTLH